MRLAALGQKMLELTVRALNSSHLPLGKDETEVRVSLLTDRED